MSCISDCPRGSSQCRNMLAILKLTMRQRGRKKVIFINFSKALACATHVPNILALSGLNLPKRRVVVWR